MPRTRKKKGEFTLKDGVKWTLIAGTGVLTTIIVHKIYKLLTKPEEELVDLEYDPSNFDFQPGYNPEREALILYDLMQGVSTTNSQFSGTLNIFSDYNDDMMKATVNAWNNTIPNQGLSLYTWIASEWCDYWWGYDECKKARSRALQRLTQVGASAKFKKKRS